MGVYGTTIQKGITFYKYSQFYVSPSCSYLHVHFFFFFFFFFLAVPVACESSWARNPSHSSNPSYCSDDARSLTSCATRELLHVRIFYTWYHTDNFIVFHLRFICTFLHICMCILIFIGYIHVVLTFAKIDYYCSWMFTIFLVLFVFASLANSVENIFVCL